ncbi:MAG TPA: TolC family protein, partial [Candidatus Binataceae bacterium]|nr:TolC family protein [Candidatus Binataceae bacterium]
QLQYETSIANDQTTLDQLLYRPVDSPLEVNRTLELQPLTARLDALVDKAAHARQEILEAALAENNSTTALNLAKMEYLPDFTVAYEFDNWLVPSFAPTLSGTQTHSLSIGINVPLFFWIKQSEDVTKSRYDLEAARDNLELIRSQTAASVTSLYRSAIYAYRTALLYRDTLSPLARQDFKVALTAYQSGKVDFVTMSGALQRDYAARISYLQAANQFLAGEVSLEQAIGAPLLK